LLRAGTRKSVPDEAARRAKTEAGVFLDAFRLMRSVVVGLALLADESQEALVVVGLRRAPAPAPSFCCW
jgi:hypothetical protein